MHPRVTVLQLDTHFPRVAGDVGCAATYLGDVEIMRIAGATVGQVVSSRPDLIDIAPFEEALDRATGDVIVTSCGFLSYWQGHLKARTSKPFISSALTALDWLSEEYEPAEVLTLTFDVDSLTARHFGAHADYAKGTVGLPENMHLRQVISQNLSQLNTNLAATELAQYIKAVQGAQHRHLLFECTNLPPYKAAMQRETGLPVTDILTCIERMMPDTIQPRFLG